MERPPAPRFLRAATGPTSTTPGASCSRNVTTTWQTVYVPFGLLAPRYLPAQATTGPCADGRHLLRGSGLQSEVAAGLQFSVYDQFPKTGVTDGNYDLWVDDVAFYKGTNGLATFTSSTGTAKTFPVDSATVAGMPQADWRGR